MSTKAAVKWKMPKWMEPYRKLICNTGGNSIEDMMNGNADPAVNLPLSMLQACVKSQVLLLEALREEAYTRLLPSALRAKLREYPSAREIRKARKEINDYTKKRMKEGGYTNLLDPVVTS
jgi:hypothetical protein